MMKTSKDFKPYIEESAFTLLPDEFKLVSQLCYDKCGITLEDNKLAMVQSRLYSLFKEHGYKNFKQFYDTLIAGQHKETLTRFIDRLVTNHSFFYRENSHFIFLKNTVFPDYLRKGHDINEIRLWCAGCAQGEEAYSIAICLAESLQSITWPQQPVILATDISRTCLKEAAQGEYPAVKLKELPPELKQRYFTQNKKNNTFLIDERLKKMLSFRFLNLQTEPYPFKRKFDVIFCRNVMIYFDEVTRHKLMTRFAAQLKVGGYLFVGSSEFFGNKISELTFMKSAAYQKC